MSPKVLITVLIIMPSAALADLTNTQICNLAESSNRLNEVSFNQCICAMDRADLHLEPDMKLALVEAMVAGTSPVHAMLARGYKMNVIANRLQIYGAATWSDCGIPQLS